MSSAGKKKAVPQQDRSTASTCHLISCFVGFWAPLFFMMMQKSKSRWLDGHFKECLNFHLTLLIGHLVGPCTFLILNIVCMIMAIIYGLQASSAAGKGQRYSYPFKFTFVS
jgi:uncharacterized Tic20 family protein